MEKEEYYCIQCSSHLEAKDDEYYCSACNKSWVIDQKIPRFAESELFWSVFSEDVASKVVDYAENNSWSDAIREFSDSIDPYTLGYISNYSRCDWNIVLPISKNSTIVDIGSGWGNIGITLAKRAKKVFCGDANMYNLRLLNTRIKEEKARNISTFLYDANVHLKLPFKTDSIDIVCLNGVLEWIGNVPHKSSPRELQIEALKEIRRILKPGGYLYIGIENRYSFSTLRGHRLHYELPFVGLFPRILSNFITKLVKKEEHRTYVYSIYGYRKLLREAGYGEVDFYWPYPSYHDPNYIVPLKDKWVVKYWLDHIMVNKSKKYRLLKKYGVTNLPLYLFAYSYGMRVEK